MAIANTYTPAPRDEDGLLAFVALSDEDRTRKQVLNGMVKRSSRTSGNRILLIRLLMQKYIKRGEVQKINRLESGLIRFFLINSVRRSQGFDFQDT